MTALTVGRVVSLLAAVRPRPVPTETTGRVLREEVVSAAEQASRILAAAEATGAARLTAFEQDMDRLRREMREELAAELAVEHAGKLVELVALRSRAIHQAQDEIVQLARMLAERVLREELTLHPERLVDLARAVLRETAGAQRITLYATPEGVNSLKKELERLTAWTVSDVSLEIIADADLRQGDLRVETDLGSIDARVGTQLAHLAATLVESIGS